MTRVDVGASSSLEAPLSLPPPVVSLPMISSGIALAPANTAPVHMLSRKQPPPGPKILPTEYPISRGRGLERMSTDSLPCSQKDEEEEEPSSCSNTNDQKNSNSTNFVRALKIVHVPTAESGAIPLIACPPSILAKPKQIRQPVDSDLSPVDTKLEEKREKSQASTKSKKKSKADNLGERRKMESNDNDDFEELTIEKVRLSGQEGSGKRKEKKRERLKEVGESGEKIKESEMKRENASFPLKSPMKTWSEDDVSLFLQHYGLSRLLEVTHFLCCVFFF